MTNAILDPTGLSERSGTAPAFTLAPRRANLNGAKIGLLENGKQNARLLLEDVARPCCAIATAPARRRFDARRISPSRRRRSCR